MKRINNKGMSLIELIISFAIVTVAVVYFSQTLSTVSKLYTKSNKETDEYVEEVYVYRILEAMFEVYSEKSQIGIAGNKFAGFDTIFIYCNNPNPANIKPLFGKNTDIQNNAGSNLSELFGAITYPRNIRDDILKDLGITEYKRHAGLNESTIEWIRVAGKKCEPLDPHGRLDDIIDLNTETIVYGSELKTANVWIPVEYYDKLCEVRRDTGIGNWDIWKKNNGDNFEIAQINNYYNPSLKLFASVATMLSGKKYTYYTEFDYRKYTSQGKIVRYFLTYQIGEEAVKKRGIFGSDTLNGGSNYKNTVRVKDFCFSDSCRD